MLSIGNNEYFTSRQLTLSARGVGLPLQLHEALLAPARSPAVPRQPVVLAGVRRAVPFVGENEVRMSTG